MAYWIPLHIANANTATPELLVSFDFSATGYTVDVTDLSRLWSEELDRRQLIKRALNENTSIDPSEDGSQLRILLSKIKGALQGDDKTNCQITAFDEDDLLLNVDCALPPPLDRLQWRIELRLQPQELVRGRVTQPLVERLGAMSAQEEGLLRLVHDKDNVITKLLDKLESSGTDISDVFPGITGNKTSRKAITRTQAAQHVKGLGRFDQGQWLDQARAVDGGMNRNEVIPRVFKTGSVPAKPKQPDKAAWGWQKELKEVDVTAEESIVPIPSRVKEEIGMQARQATPPLSQSLEEDYSDFQRQSTPTSAQKPQAYAMDDADTETDEDDLDAPASKKQHCKAKNAVRSPAEQTSTPPKSKKLGQIGGKPKPGEDTRRTEDAQGRYPTAQTDAEPPATKPRPKTKLGKIGGSKPTRNATPEPVMQMQTAGTPSPARGCGRIGGTGENTPSKNYSTRPSEGRAKESGNEMDVDRVEETQLRPKPMDEDPPASSQDRADRKREELKRQLEAKAQAPVKKKRRF